MTTIQLITVSYSLKKNKILESRSKIDDLTGGFEKIAGIEKLKDYINEAKSSNTPLSLVFIDINNMKKINDRFGHLEGDNALRIVANSIKKSIRSKDFYVRFGGDEFLVILPNCSKESANKVCERIINEINNYQKIYNLSYDLSVSFGISEWNNLNNHSVMELLEEADSEMYKYKNNIKNNMFHFNSK